MCTQISTSRDLWGDPHAYAPCSAVCVMCYILQMDCFQCIRHTCLCLLVVTEKRRPEEDIKDLDAKNKITRDMVSSCCYSFFGILDQFDC